MQGVDEDPAPRPVDGRSRRWAEHRRARRAEFVDAAVAAVRRHGPDIGLDEVAAEIGVSKSVVYRHFTDRADLFSAVLDRIADDVLLPRLMGELALLGSPAAGDTTDRLLDAAAVRAVVRAYVAVVDGERELYRFALAHGHEGGTDFVAAVERRVAESLAALLDERLRALRQDAAGAQVWAYGVVGLVQLATQHWAEGSSMPAEVLVDHLTAQVLGGLDAVTGARPSPA